MSEKVVVTKSYLEDIGKQIIAKGGATAPMKPQDMAAAIAAIPSGDSYDFIKPDGWPNLRDIVKSVPKDGYAHRIAFLIFIDPEDSPEDCVTPIFNGCVAVCDGEGTVSGSNIVWSTTGYHWYVLLTNEPNGVRQATSNGAYDTKAIKWICGDGESSLYCTTPTIAPSYCECVECIEGCDLYLTAYAILETKALRFIDCASFYAAPNSNANGMFRNSPSLISIKASGSFRVFMPACFSGACRALENIPLQIDTSGLLNCQNIMSGAYALKKIGNYFDFSSVSISNNSPFNNIYALNEMPSVIVPSAITTSGKFEIDFSQSNLISKESLFEFAKFGTIPDGHPSAGKSGDATGFPVRPLLKLSPIVRSMLTKSEQADFATSLSNHGWDLSW